MARAKTCTAKTAQQHREETAILAAEGILRYHHPSHAEMLKKMVTSEHQEAQIDPRWSLPTCHKTVKAVAAKEQHPPTRTEHSLVQLLSVSCILPRGVEMRMSWFTAAAAALCSDPALASRRPAVASGHTSGAKRSLAPPWRRWALLQVTSRPKCFGLLPTAARCRAAVARLAPAQHAWI